MINQIPDEIDKTPHKVYIVLSAHADHQTLNVDYCVISQSIPFLLYYRFFVLFVLV
jgi:hypothetical protein